MKPNEVIEFRPVPAPRVCAWCPGDGHNYLAYATPMLDPVVGDQRLSDTWVVAFPEWGVCIQVTEGTFLTQAYVSGKLADLYPKWGPVFFSNRVQGFMGAIGAVVPQVEVGK